LVLRRIPAVTALAVSAAEDAVPDTVSDTLPATEEATSDAPDEADTAGFSALDSSHAVLAGSSRRPVPARPVRRRADFVLAMKFP
jgi:hypothetical protein